MKMTMRHGIVVSTVAILVGYYFNSQYSPDQRFTLFFLNKTVANLAIVLIAISYLLGSLCILIPGFARYLSYRRHFGVAGFLAVVVHIILAFLQWNARFPFSWYVGHKYGVTAAIGATLIFTALALTSHNRLIKDLGSKRWKFVQRLGYLALILGLFHVYIAAGNRWQQWLAGEVDMPNSVVAFGAGVLILIVRLLALLHGSFSKRKR